MNKHTVIFLSKNIPTKLYSKRNTMMSFNYIQSLDISLFTGNLTYYKKNIDHQLLFTMAYIN